MDDPRDEIIDYQDEARVIQRLAADLPHDEEDHDDDLSGLGSGRVDANK